MTAKIHTYAELQDVMMADLRKAHPEWSADTFDSYEARLSALFEAWSENRTPPLSHPEPRTSPNPFQSIRSRTLVP